MDSIEMEPDSCMGSVAIRSILSNPLKAAPTKKEEKESTDVYTDATAAFLGPNIWDKMTDFKLDYLDLDAILGNSPENKQEKVDDILEQATDEKVPQFHQLTPHNPSNVGLPGSMSNGIVGQQMITDQQTSHSINDVHHLQCQLQGGERNVEQYPCFGIMHSSPEHMSSQPSSPLNSSSSSVEEFSRDNKKRKYSVDCKFSPTDLALATPPGQDHYDPASTVFPDEELKPQPIIKKSRKNFVPDNLKDDKYWARRHKNNMAAKRSREARRLKENQIVLRASYLEKENNSLKEDVMRLKAENDMLKNQLKEYRS